MSDALTFNLKGSTKVSGQINTVYGLSAYEIAVINGFDGTEQEWLDSIPNDAAEIVESDLEENTEFVFYGGDASGKGDISLIEDETYKGCFYRMVDGEKEWINPPLLENIKYRTTERFYGVPVYTKLITFNANSTASSVQFSNDGKAINVLRHTATVAGGVPLPNNVSSDDGYAEVYIRKYNDVAYYLEFKKGSNASSTIGGTGYAQIWFVEGVIK